MAALADVAETTMVQSVKAGPMVKGSSLGLAGGNGCKFRGNICFTVSSNQRGFGFVRYIPLDLRGTRG